MRGKRHSQEQKQKVADRVNGGESPEAIAKELGISKYTVGDWSREFRRKPRRVKRKVAPAQPKENTRVSELETKIKELEMEKEVWRNAYNAVITSKG